MLKMPQTLLSCTNPAVWIMMSQEFDLNMGYTLPTQLVMDYQEYLDAELEVYFYSQADAGSYGYII